MKTHKITGGGSVQLHVVETGNQRGRPVVFLHGVSQSSLTWNLQMSSSMADARRLVAMDLRGHGFSDKPDTRGPRSPSSPWQNYEKRTSGDEVCGTGKKVPSADKSGECVGR